MAEPRIQTLASSNDWDRWIILIEMMAGAMGIWDYIDPDQPNKKPPEKPTFSSTEGKSEADKGAHDVGIPGAVVRMGPLPQSSLEALEIDYY